MRESDIELMVHPRTRFFLEDYSWRREFMLMGGRGGYDNAMQLLGHKVLVSVNAKPYGLKDRKWIFPEDRFITYEKSDITWCRYFGIGREQKAEIEIGEIVMMRKLPLMSFSDSVRRVNFAGIRSASANPREMSVGTFCDDNYVDACRAVEFIQSRLVRYIRELVDEQNSKELPIA